MGRRNVHRRTVLDYLQDTEGQLQENGSVEFINARVEGPHRAFCHHPRGPARWSLRAFADVFYE